MSNVYLTELTNQKKKLATILNNKGVVASETEKFNTLVPKVAQVQNLKSEEKVVDNISTYNDTPESIVQLEYPEDVEKNIDLQLQSKNLIPYPYTQTTKTEDGVTFTDNGDGSITVNGTATANVVEYVLYSGNRFPINNTVYTISGCPSGGSRSTYYIMTRNGFSDTGTGWYKTNADNDLSRIVIRISKGVTVENLVFKPQIELGSNLTPYTPYISDLTSVNVTACGKNLIPYPYAKGGTITQNGGTFVINDNGTITVSGTPTAYAGFSLVNTSPIPVVKSGKYTISIGTNADNVYMALFLYDKDKTQLAMLTVTPSSSKTFDFKDYPTATLWNISLARNSSNVQMSGTVYPQLELGSTATPYEPYQGQTYTPTSDGKVTGISSIYPTTNIFTDNAGALITVKGGAYKEILPSTDKNGITKVWQEVVGSDIDENIKPENIKKGITILGVTGTLTGQVSAQSTLGIDFKLGESTLA